MNYGLDVNFTFSSNDDVIFVDIHYIDVNDSALLIIMSLQYISG